MLPVPSQACAVNWSHPLARGLHHCYVAPQLGYFNATYPTGVGIYDLGAASAHLNLPTGAQNLLAGSGKLGRCMLAGTQSTCSYYGVSNITDAFNADGKYTFAMLIEWPSSGSPGTFFAHWTRGYGSTPRAWFAGGSTSIARLFVGTSTGNLVADMAGITADEAFLWVAVYRGDVGDGSKYVDLYKNGAFYSTTSKVGAAPAAATTCWNELGPTVTPQVKIYGVWAWTRALGAQEIAGMYADPWLMFEPRRYSFKGPTAATKAYYYNRFIASRGRDLQCQS